MNYPLNIAFIWHQHQPLYKAPLTNTYVLPWVRLHAVKDYYHMVSILDKFPNIKQTFNLVPSLLDQLNDYINKNADDMYLNITLKDAQLLTHQDKKFVLREFFILNKENMIEPNKRLNQLFEKRNEIFTSKIEDVIDSFTCQDFRDIQVLSNLVWFDNSYIEQDDLIKDLINKERDYTEEDKQNLIEKQNEIIQKIIPKHKELMDKNRIEIATSPFYHPIIPLLINNNIAKISDPSASLPNQEFKVPQDAEYHFKKAINLYESLFGIKPKGMWPPECAVSNEALMMVADMGIKWILTDSIIFNKSKNLNNRMDNIYHPYKFVHKGNELNLFFRNDELSDLIGFSYAERDAKQAVSDFMGRLERIHQNLPQSNSSNIVVIALDGENCWEFYKNNGNDFLNELYKELSNREEFRTVTISEYLSNNHTENEIRNIYPGSWMKGDFHVWIGSKEKNKAWDLLKKTRDELVKYQKLHENKDNKDNKEKIDKAWDSIYIAEGSDWFWWLGEDNNSEQDHIFDQLFRNYLKSVYEILKLKVPEELILIK